MYWWVFIDNDLDDGICDADDICPNDPFNDLDGDSICRLDSSSRPFE